MHHPTRRPAALATLAAAALSTALFAGLFGPAHAHAQAPAPSASEPPPAEACTPIQIDGLRAAQGRVMLAVYADADSYPRRPVATISQDLGAGASQRFAICGLNGREVALSLFQDLNANGRLDSNVMGVPTEPWGASGRTPPMSAPSWASSRIVLDGTVLRIVMSQ